MSGKVPDKERALQIYVLGLGMQICVRAWLAGGIHLLHDTAVHWLYTTSNVGGQFFPGDQAGKTFVIDCGWA